MAKKINKKEEKQFDDLLDIGLTDAVRRRLEQFQKIIDVGRELFGSKGSHSFSTHELARRMGMSQGNIYNYVESKRELWLAIRKQDYKKYKDNIQNIITNHQGSYRSLFRKLAVFFLDFARNERRKFQMMYLTPVPTSKKLGRIEKNYKAHYPQYLLKEVIDKGIEAKEIIDVDSTKLSILMFAMVYGIAAAETALSLKNPIQEPLFTPEDAIHPQEFREFALDFTFDLIKRK